MNEQLRFDGRVAIITGAGGGAGAAYAAMLGARGARVAVVDRKRLNGGEYATAQQLRENGAEAISIEADICDDQAVAALVARVVETFGGLDILINNAGISELTLDVTLPPDGRLEAMLDIHLRAPMKLISSAWPHLQKSGSGRIINIGSSSAFGCGFEAPDGSTVWETAYATAKGTVFALTRQAAGAGAMCGIKANMIIPWAWTPMTKGNLEGTNFGNWMAEHMSPDRLAALAANLAHVDCPSNGAFFSAAGGRYSRVIFGSLPAYFNRSASAEDLRDNWAAVAGTAASPGHFDDVFEILGVESEFAEIQRLVGPVG